MSERNAIRVLTRQDLPAVLRLWMALMQTGERADARFEPVPDAPRVIETYARDMWTRTTPFPHGFVAENDGEVVGFLAGIPVRVVPILNAEPTAQITDIWVEPAHRRSGLGRALVSRFQMECRAAGYAHFDVSTLAADARAMAFWRDLGFGDWTVNLTTRS